MCVRTVTIYVYGYAEVLSMVYISTKINNINNKQNKANKKVSFIH